jgi:aryl-alcohol dehydrogenase-like predicted oxidoreductase
MGWPKSCAAFRHWRSAARRAPIVGATKLHHLDDALASVNVKLSADEITSLEEPYVPHAVVGFV